ncbi:MAG: NUDIX hydrolase [Clostridia bacterium]|nr:NUDIX hydrolase [Clostridia bacterium]
MTEKTIKSTPIYDGRVFSVRSDIALLCDNSQVQRDVVLHNGGVGVLAIDESRKITLVKQYRYGASCMTLEIPAGKLEKGENPEECGKRELLEEAGYVAESFISLGEILPTPAYCSEVIYLYLATKLTKKEQHLDEDEFLDVITMDLDEAYNMVMRNEIKDAKTIAAILKAKGLGY